MRKILISIFFGVLTLAGCGGGGLAPSSSGGSPPPSGPNVQSLTVDAGPAALSSGAVNVLYTTVTVCVPGSTTCQTIDHIQVDTASSGLRILASALAVSLPLITDSSNNAFVECLPFADGSSWGPLRKADVKISGESASGQTVQIIGDSAYPNVPPTCTGIPENTVAAFGANGLLGVSPFIQDCGSACATTQSNGIYYVCSSPASTSCQQTILATSAQVSNPVTAFATDNNGVIIQLPSVSASGMASVAGYLLFGIGTQGNNALGSASVYTLDPTFGTFTTEYKGSALSGSVADSGSNAYFFPDQITTCSDLNNQFYCPASTLSLSGTIQGVNGTNATINFSIANADTLLRNNPNATALSNLGGPVTSSSGSSSTPMFDWGLPFFYGRSVYTAIEQHNTSGGMGPYIAF